MTIAEIQTERYDVETSVSRDKRTGRWHLVEQRVAGCCEIDVRYRVINPQKMNDSIETVTKQEIF